MDETADDPLDPLVPLVEQCLAALEDEGDAALERVYAQHPAEAATLRDRIRQLRELGLVRLPDTPASDAFPERLGEFRLLNRIGIGGMGVVYRARQESLGRDVALKVVRPEQLYFPQAKERFRREIETIGRLQHPSIVPVYCVGEEAGAPYFAMELLHGASLAQLVKALDGRDPAGLTGADLARTVATIAQDAEVPPEAAEANYLFTGTWSDACVRIVRQVADALIHAHGRGVLHRDVKPSNVVVTPRGRVVLLDFGLASSRAAGDLTRTGSLLGSLPYLPPERARGDGQTFDARGDVYSLGVTLYELLTLRLPFPQRETSALLAAIDAGLPRPPRTFNRTIGRDVETVCLVAMDAAPGARYASAADFARDLDNVLARRPIEARRVGALVHVVRWMQRKPAAAVALVLSLLVLVGGPIAYAWVQYQARLQLQEANTRTGEQRVRAERYFRHALGTIDRLIEPLRRETTEDIAEVAHLKSEILEQALSSYAVFTPEETTDPEFRRDLAVAARQLGDIRGALDDRPAACKQFEEAIDLLEPLVRADPQDADRVVELALARLRLAHSRADVARYDDAIALFRATLTDLERLSAPEAAPLSRALLWCDAQGSVGQYLFALGSKREGEELCRRTIAILREFEARDGAPGPVRVRLGEECMRLGDCLLLDPRRYEDAAVLLREAVDLFDEEVRLDPHGRLGQRHVAQARWSLAHALLFTGKEADALACARRAAQDLEPIVQRFPESMVFRRSLVAAIEEAASAELALDRLDEARADAERALALSRELRDADPEQDSLGYANAQMRLAHVLAAQRRWDPARDLAASAIEWMATTGRKLGSKLHLSTSRTWRWDLLRYDAESGAGERLLDDVGAQLEGSTLARDRIDAARLLARCAVVVRADESLTDDEQDRRAGAVEEALLELLSAVKEKGGGFGDLAADASIGDLARRPDLRAALDDAGLDLPEPPPSK